MGQALAHENRGPSPALADDRPGQEQPLERAGSIKVQKKLTRAELIQSQIAVRNSTKSLYEILPEMGLTARTCYLQTLAEMIGKPPPGRKWEDEWVPLRCEQFRMSPTPSIDVNWTDAQLEHFVRTENTVELFQKNKRQGSIDALVKRGWPQDAARTFAILSICSGPIARALKERDPCYVASTYALCQALYSVESKSTPPPMLYRHLRGQFSLMQVDPQWERLLTPDSTGFCGTNNCGLTFGDCDPANFSETGYMRRYQDKDGPKYFPEDSDVVGFISAPADEHGSHAAVCTYGDLTGAFPPNTMFRLQKTIPPGEWEAPGGAFPKQRLLVCSATYLPPLPQGQASQGGTRKFCENTATLTYGNRSAFIKGLDDLIAKPMLNMKQEYDRDLTWRDWKGVEYSLRQEWAYVNGPAMPKRDCTPGHRDARNEGKTPDDFLAEINDYIQKRRDEGYGLRRSPEHAFLTRKEMLAIRLYSGPVYQPLNGFLRQVANLSGDFRMQLAMHVDLTFTMTVRHLCCGIRKIAAVAKPDELHRNLYRGGRGELPGNFFLGDEREMVCAVDMAFMSTSKNRQTPVHYMSNGLNVLWELEVQPESDTGFHYGADISMLSQFAGEEEVLFPPCTMLRVKARKAEEVKEVEGDRGRSRWMAEEGSEGDKHYLQVSVLPAFL